LLSEAARSVLDVAHSAAHADYLVHNYCFQPEEYDEAMDRMRLAAVELTDRDRKLLARLWRSALAATASLDPDDHETLVGYRVHLGSLHWYYRMASGMVERVLREKEMEESRMADAEREPVDLRDDIPF
jgi:hypothetical protein